MTETITASTEATMESERQKYNARIAAKRKKGHSVEMIASYAASRPVPLDQLDLTRKNWRRSRNYHVRDAQHCNRADLVPHAQS
jgi:hypothetical protein